MIKIKKGNALVFGLSDENIKRLKDGNPIHFNLNELGMPNTDIFIFNGRDEQEMYKMFKNQIDPLRTKMFNSKSSEN